MEIPRLRWRAVQKNYRERGLILVLDAGVSGLQPPDWQELIYRLADSVSGQHRRAKLTALLKSGYTLPALAGLIDV